MGGHTLGGASRILGSLVHPAAGPRPTTSCALSGGVSPLKPSSHQVAPAASYAVSGALAVHDGIATSNGASAGRSAVISPTRVATFSGGRSPIGITPS